MKHYSTREAAKKLGLTHVSLSRYVAVKKVPGPRTAEAGKFRLHLWTDEDIERVRKILPTIKNGRKTRYQKERAKKAFQSKGSKKASKKK